MPPATSGPAAATGASSRASISSGPSSLVKKTAPPPPPPPTPPTPPTIVAKSSRLSFLRRNPKKSTVVASTSRPSVVERPSVDYGNKSPTKSAHDARTKEDKIFNFSLDVFIHISVLFLFLSLFFYFYMSNKLSSALNEEINYHVGDQTTRVLNDYNKSNGGTVSDEVKKINIDKIIQKYNGAPELSDEKNSRLFDNVFWVNGVLFLIIILIILLRKRKINSNIDLLHIIQENIVIFIFVACIEFTLFYFMAQNYIPAPPSLIAQTTINKLKEKIDSRIKK
jgi:hypothetical protein